MPQRNAHVVTHKPKGLSDAVDGTNAFPGAMQLLSNLVPDPATTDVWIPRVAAILKTLLGGNPTALLIIGDIAYGLVNSATHAGKDDPFAYNIATNTFLTITGVLSTNVPTSQPTTGDWTPPILCQAGPRIVVTHVGFPGATQKIGWFDISGLNITTIGNLQPAVTFTGDTDTTKQPFIVGAPVTLTNSGLVFPNAGDPVPAQLGATVTGANIPANTTIVSAQGVKVTLSGALTSASATVASLADPSTGAPSTAGVFVGQSVSGDGIPLNTTITSINRGAFTMVISQNATKTQTTGLSITGTQLQLSKNVTGTADNTTFTVTNNLITGNPNVLGVQPGMTITGTGVPANTTVVSAKTLSTTLVCSLTAGNQNVVGASSIFGVTVGMTVSGTGVPSGTTVTAVSTPNQTITLSQAIAGFTGFASLIFIGAAIQISTTFAGPNLGVTLTIQGGTTTAPQWGAGDTMTNNLPSVPVGVGQMSGRAWYACGTDGIVFSDPLVPCTISNTLGVQALLPGNGLPVTAIGALQLTNLTGGIVQGLIAFQGVAQMLQITGDPVTGDLRMNALPVATGTHAPLTIAGTPLGMMFMSPAGLRFVDFTGRVSDPVGQNGTGVTLPFIQANPASRMCAACNGSIIRISTPTSSGIAYEYWYDLGLKLWHGPHTCAAQLIETWSDTFILAPAPSIIPGQGGQLWQSDDTPNSASTYVENNAQLNWGFGTILLPDNGMGVMNAMTEGALFLALVQGLSVSVVFVDERGNVLDTVTILGTAAAPGWGGFTWGGQIWGAQGPAPQERALLWNQPLVFKQGRLIATGPSDASVRVGNAYLKHQILGYQLGNAV